MFFATHLKSTPAWKCKNTTTIVIKRPRCGPIESDLWILLLLCDGVVFSCAKPYTDMLLAQMCKYVHFSVLLFALPGVFSVRQYVRVWTSCSPSFSFSHSLIYNTLYAACILMHTWIDVVWCVCTYSMRVWVCWAGGAQCNYYSRSVRASAHSYAYWCVFLHRRRASVISWITCYSSNGGQLAFGVSSKCTICRCFVCVCVFVCMANVFVACRFSVRFAAMFCATTLTILCFDLCAVRSKAHHHTHAATRRPWTRPECCACSYVWNKYIYLCYTLLQQQQHIIVYVLISGRKRQQQRAKHVVPVPQLQLQFGVCRHRKKCKRCALRCEGRECMRARARARSLRPRRARGCISTCTKIQCKYYALHCILYIV